MNLRSVFAVLLICCLAGCGGGGEDESGARRFVAAMHAQSEVRAAGEIANPPVVDFAAVFDWAEWKYPAQFPKGAESQYVLYQSVSYLVRAYSSGNYIGISGEQIYVYGPFTNDTLLRVGSFYDFIPLVQADFCQFRCVGCAPPVIAAQPVNQYILAGQSATFSVNATSSLPAAYRWQVSANQGATFTDIEGAIGSSYSLSTTALADSGRQYRVVVSNRDGVVTSTIASLTVRSAQSVNFFPIDPGSRWVYRRSDSSTPDVVRIVGTQFVDSGELGTAFETVDGRDRSTTRDVFVVAGDGVRQYLTDHSDPISLALNGLQLLRLPVVPGETLQQLNTTVDSGTDVDSDGQTDPAHLEMSFSVVGMESLNTPAAYFSSALHLRQVLDVTLLGSTGIRAQVRSTADVWYVDGVGQVKWILHTVGSDADRTATYTLESYKVAGLSSDVTPPQLRSAAPQGPQRTTVRDVWTDFGESIDPASIGPDSLVVTDSQGRRVPGAVVAEASGPRLSGQDLLPAGDYVVRIAAGLSDLSGNRLAQGMAWTFSIDTSLPSIASIAPGDGARDVELSTVVVVTFSEPPRPDTVSESTIALRLGSTAVAATRSIRGNTVILTPAVPLQPASTYSVSVGGVSDLAGNPLSSGFGGTFQTVDGRFAAPVPLGGTMSFTSTMAIADINGDGLPDVLGLSSDFTMGRQGVFVRYGRTDGSLADPVLVAGTNDLDCLPGGMAVGDLDGDGRADLVIFGIGLCGTRVHLQSSAGSLLPARPWNDVGSWFRFSNLDGNGKTVLLSSSEDGIAIWRRNAAGMLELSQTVTFPSASFGEPIEIDVNADGRLDLVAAYSGNQRGNIAVLLRRADGSFASPIVVDTNFAPYSMAGIAAADLNGDGKIDIVASLGDNVPNAALAVFYQLAGGGFSAAIHVASADIPGSIVTADVNKDGLADVVVPHIGWNTVGIYWQRQDGTLAPEEQYKAPYVPTHQGQLAVGDIDGDGWLDIVMGGSVIRQVPPVGKTVMDEGRPTAKPILQSAFQHRRWLALRHGVPWRMSPGLAN